MAPTFANTSGPNEAAPSKIPDIVPFISGNQRNAVLIEGLYKSPFPAPAIKPQVIYSINKLGAKAVSNHPIPKTNPPIYINFLGPDLSTIFPEIIPNNDIVN
ncbi:hypothetical protein D3C76_1299800 [compost metagenome]